MLKMEYYDYFFTAFTLLYYYPTWKKVFSRREKITRRVIPLTWCIQLYVFLKRVTPNWGRKCNIHFANRGSYWW